MDYVAPVISEAIGRLTFAWQGMDLKIIADRITDDGTAELWFYHANGNGDSLLHTAKTNLLSTSTINQLQKRMATHSPDVPWGQILTCITAKSLGHQRKGDPGEILTPTMGVVEHPGYYIEPTIIKGLPSIIHGEKGSHKTTLSLLMLGLLAIGIDDSPTGLIANEPAKVGILDWENDKDTTLYTLSQLIKSETCPYFEPAYMRCALSLSDDINRIAEFVNDHRLEVILIDSLGQAAGSDQFDSAGKRSALRFFENLRRLKVTSLIIGQEAKNEEGKKSIYGSVYYRYYARNIFELKAKRDEMDPTITHLGLFHTDANYSRLYAPIGFRATHNENGITIDSEPMRISEFIEKAKQINTLLAFLQDGAQSRNAISDALKIPRDQISVLLNRAAKRKLIINLGDNKWGLLSEED